MERLFHASIHFLESLKNEDRNGYAEKNIQVATEMVLWWSDKNQGQTALFGSYIEVSDEFFKAVMKAPSPLDIRVLRHIKDSSLGIDLYTCLLYTSPSPRD